MKRARAVATLVAALALPATASAAPAPAAKSTTTPSGLHYTDLVVGKGAMPKPGQSVTVQYTGWLTNGTKFDSSRDRNEPFTFVIGQGNVITGWDQGVATMRVGGRRRLRIPPELGYGPAGAGNGVIPPNATLIFDIELLAVK
jgi:peptidylprolyl isomerase